MSDPNGDVENLVSMTKLLLRHFLITQPNPVIITDYARKCAPLLFNTREKSEQIVMMAVPILIRDYTQA